MDGERAMNATPYTLPSVPGVPGRPFRVGVVNALLALHFVGSTRYFPGDSPFVYSAGPVIGDRHCAITVQTVLRCRYCER
jgi:hypothetical protein